jgi:hypothetical protein
MLSVCRRLSVTVLLAKPLEPVVPKISTVTVELGTAAKAAA